MVARKKKTAEESLVELGNEYATLLEVKAKTEARIGQIQAELRELFPELSKQLVGPLEVRIQRNVKRDDAAFMAAYPFDDFPDYYKATIDTDAIKRDLSPAVLEKFQIEGPHKVIPVVLEDTSV